MCKKRLSLYLKLNTKTIYSEGDAPSGDLGGGDMSRVGLQREPGGSRSVSSSSPLGSLKHNGFGVGRRLFFFLSVSGNDG